MSLNDSNEQLEIPDERKIMPEDTIESMLFDMGKRQRTLEGLLLDMNKRLRAVESSTDTIKN